MAGFFDTLFGGGAETEAADKNRALLGQFQGQGLDYLKTGYDTSTANINKGIAAYDPLAALATKYGKGGDLYMDALGVNGPAGNTRATGAFQTTPGYTLASEAGQDAINRRRGIGGMYYSGNADQDAQSFGQNLLYQTQYAPWMAGLQGLNQDAMTTTGQVAAGQAGGYGSLANLATQYGTDQTGIASTVASGDIAANNMQAAGEAAGAKNLLGAGMSLATLGLGGNPFGGSGMTGGGSSLFGKLGTGLGFATGLKSPTGY